MASWKRARTQDRDSAVELISAAYADGQLTDAERDDKVSRALQARTLGEVRQATADLQGPASDEPDRTGDTDDSIPTRVRRWFGDLSRRSRVILVGGVLAAGSLTAYVVLEPDDRVPAGESARQQYSVDAVDAALVRDLVSGYEEQFGTTRTYGVLVYRDWVRVHVPTEDGRARYTIWSLREDGELVQTDGPVGARDLREFDLADVDLDAVAATIDRARDELGVEDVDYVAVTLQHTVYRGSPEVLVNVSNEFDEDAYVITDLSGRVVDQDLHSRP